MTALTEYDRLECLGLWREKPEAQRREVIVALGDATLVLSDTRSARALAHWSLPATERTNPGQRPAHFRPGPDAEDDLEIADDAMVSAIGRVHAALAARRPHPGRLRTVLLSGAMALVVAILLFWLPGAAVRHAARVAPPALRAEIGALVLADLTRVTGQPCSTPQADRALDRLHARLLPAQAGRIVVLPEALIGSAHLPGDLILIGRGVLEDSETPDVAAGYILAEALRAAAADPLEQVLARSGPWSALRLLTSGSLPPDAVEGQAETMVAVTPSKVDDEALLARFGAAAVPATPYALDLDPTGETTIGLIEADPLQGRPTLPLLPDAEWLSLQDICAG